MSSSFANNPIQSISAFSIKSNAVTIATTPTTVALETTISFAPITGISSASVAQPSSSSIVAPISTPLISSLTTNSILSTPTPTTTITTTSASANAGHKGLSHGGLAGVIVGSVIGGLMLLGFICLLILRKKRSKSHRISYHNQEKSPLPDAITTPQQHFRHSYRNSAMSQNSTLRSLHTQRVTNGGFTPFSVPISTTTPTSTEYSVESPSTPIVDEDFWQNSPPIGTFTIVSSYTQTLDDELYIQPGDQVQVYTEYDDGWCLGINLTRGGSRGVFPQHCLGNKEA